MPYKHFTSDERDALQVMNDRGLDKKSIARILCKDPSSIYRELDRNTHHRCYISGKAELKAQKRRLDSCSRPKLDNKLLVREIVNAVFFSIRITRLSKYPELLHSITQEIHHFMSRMRQFTSTCTR